jgi:hypothetical protein
MRRPAVQGSCHCGRVRFELRLPTLMVSHCHCASCRKIHGAAFVTWTAVLDDAFRVLEGQEHLVGYLSSPGVTRSFCARCGAHVLYRSLDLPGRAYVPLAALDAPLDSAPSMHVNYAEKVPWLTMEDELPRHDAFDDE